MSRRLKVVAAVVLGLGLLTLPGRKFADSRSHASNPRHDIDLLSANSSASVATMIQIPYSSAYSAPENQLCEFQCPTSPRKIDHPSGCLCVDCTSELTRDTDEIANIILWTVVECSLGTLAGSLPMMRQVFGSFARSGSSAPPAEFSPRKDIEFQTIARFRGKQHPIYDTDLVVTMVGGDDDVENDHDGESTKRMIKVKTTLNRRNFAYFGRQRSYHGP